MSAGEAEWQESMRDPDFVAHLWAGEVESALAIVREVEALLNAIHHAADAGEASDAAQLAALGLRSLVPVHRELSESWDKAARACGFADKASGVG